MITVDSPADTHTIQITPEAFAGEGRATYALVLTNTNPKAALFLRLTPEAFSSSWVKIIPSELALGPGERQSVLVHVETKPAKAALTAGGAPASIITLFYQRLNGGGESPLLAQPRGRKHLEGTEFAHRPTQGGQGP